MAKPSRIGETALTDQPLNQPPYQPGPPIPPPFLLAQIAPPPKKRRIWPWAAGATAGVLILCCGIAGILGDTKQPKNQAATEATTTAATPVAVNTPSPATTSPAPKTTTPKPPKVTYKPLTAREWKLIAKNPDNYTGKHYIVYGVVTQFDAATGTDTFRADVSHKNMAETYEYDTNTLLTGDAAKLANVVQDDEFRATVTVLGSYSYDTQIGGNTTVPLLSVASIKVL